MRVAAAAAALALAGCAQTEPPLAPPVRVESFCGQKQVRITALQSIMTSTNDKLAGTAPPRGAALRVRLAREGGAIGTWDDERLRLPQTARALGEVDDYVRVRKVVAIDAPEGATTRSLYLLVRERGGERWIELTAFDVQSVCVEGRRSL